VNLAPGTRLGAYELLQVALQAGFAPDCGQNARIAGMPMSASERTRW